MQSWLSDRISFDPAICHGKPVVRGTRVLVANVVARLPADNPFRTFYRITLRSKSWTSAQVWSLPAI